MFMYRQDKSGDWTVRMSNPDCTLQVCVVSLLKQLRISFWTPHPFVTVLQTAFSIFANDAKKKVRPGAAACSCEGAWWCFSEDFISTSQGMHDNALYPNICRNVTFISTRSQWSWRKDAVVTQRILSCWVHVNLWCYNINAQRQAMSYSACSCLCPSVSARWNSSSSASSDLRGTILRSMMTNNDIKVTWPLLLWRPSTKQQGVYRLGT